MTNRISALIPSNPFHISMRETILPLIASFLLVLLSQGDLFSMQLDFKFLDLPTFRTGETGPLLGRVVIDLPAGSAPVEAKAELLLENVSSGPGETRLLYPGVSSSLDFPVKLDKAYTENNSLSGQLKVTVGDDLVLTRPVFVLVREYGMYFRTYRSSLDGSVYPYALYLPKDVDKPGAKWPLVVSLHGAWSNHANNMRRLFGIGNRPGEPDEQVFFSMPLWPQLPDAPGIVVSPWGHGTMTYHGPGALDVQEVFDLVRKEYPTDPERTSLTGLSMGGNGTWEFALRRAGEWASTYPVCAVADFTTRWTKGEKSLYPEDTKSVPGLDLSLERNLISNWVLNARGLKIHMFHGNDDPTVPIAHSERMAAALAKVGVEAPLTRFDNVGHNAWDPAYHEGKVLRELMESRRERPFRSIDFPTCRYADSRYGWLTVAEFQTFGPFATLKAAWDPAARTVTLNEVSNVTRLQFDTKELLKGAPGEISVTLRGKTLRLPPDAEGIAAVNLNGGKIAAFGKTPAAPFKRKGLEGPLYDAFCGRVILVYGTREGGNLNEALKMASWGALADLHFIIKPDTSITEKDIRDSHLVLFGDEKSNCLIERINDKFPVRFEGDKVLAGKKSFPRSEVAFKCVWPNPLNQERLVLLNYHDEWNYSSGWMGFVGFKLLPDYFIYRRGSDQAWGTPVLLSGFFDKQWRW
jgi:pimeloyl-ACP methyl ester carboxylesterase